MITKEAQAKKNLNKIIRNLPFEKYISDPKYIHQSDLKSINESLNHYELKKERQPSDAQKVGTMGHVFLHEFGDINDRYMVVPSGDGRFKAVKDLRAKAKEQAKAEGKTLITQDEFQMGFQWRESAMADPLLRSMFEADKSNHEVSAFWEYKHAGRNFGACMRMDFYGENMGIIIDSKFMQTGSPRSFYRDVWKYGYHIQCAWYLDGMKAITGQDFKFLFLVVEKTFPWNVQLYEIDQDWIDKGKEDIGKALDKLIDYGSTTDPKLKKRKLGYHDGIYTLKMKGNHGDYRK